MGIQACTRFERVEHLCRSTGRSRTRGNFFIGCQRDRLLEPIDQGRAGLAAPLPFTFMVQEPQTSPGRPGPHRRRNALAGGVTGLRWISISPR